MRPKTTLDQWHTLIAVQQSGSIQAAATALNKSHTTLIYAIKKLESQLGLDLIRIEGRRAVLTDDATTLLRRAAPMVEQAGELELIGHQLAQGRESEIIVTIDHLCNRDWLYRPIADFCVQNPGTSIQVKETSLSGTVEAVRDKAADIAIVTLPVTGIPAEAFGMTTMILIASHQHPLSAKTVLCQEDLLGTTQIVVRDLGTGTDATKQDAGWLKSQQRITVDSFDHAFDAVRAGLGFCRVPGHLLTDSDCGQITKLPLLGGTQFQVPIHLVAPKMGQTGPAAMQLYNLLLASTVQR